MSGQGHGTTQEWHRECKLRITGSRCHTYYACVPKESNSWADEVLKMLVEKFWGNCATRYGKSCEKDAAEACTEMTGDAVTNVGFVVHPSLPWLGYSQDGLIFKEGVSAILLEVESPVHEKNVKAAELVRDKNMLCEAEGANDSSESKAQLLFPAAARECSFST